MKMTSEEKDFDLAKQTTKVQKEFLLGAKLGRGGFGRIFKARRRSDEMEFAIKIIKIDFHVEDASKIRREASTLSQLSHNNIVRYYNSWIATVGDSKEFDERSQSDTDENILIINDESANFGVSFDSGAEDEEMDDEDTNSEDDSAMSEGEEENNHGDSVGEKVTRFLFIQMELCGNKTLRHAIENGLCREEAALRKYFRQTCEGLSYIHNKNIVHRDLKPENVFLTSDNDVKIGDFGLSKIIDYDDYSADSQNENVRVVSASRICGTTRYIAPEMWTRKTFSVKADIYSLGVMYFEMCAKPDEEISLENLENVSFCVDEKQKKTLIRLMMDDDDNMRPTTTQILDFLDSKDIIKKMQQIIGKKPVPRQHVDEFCATLISKHIPEDDLENFFCSVAKKTFELHGGRNISLPIFLPAFNIECVTPFVNKRGNSSAVSKTSRLAFSWYVFARGLRNIRNYSIGSVFEEDEFSSKQSRECIFQVVSRKTDDYVNEGEILHLAQEICDSLFTKSQREICYYINHTTIFEQLLNFCAIKNTVLVNMLIEAWQKRPSEEVLRKTFVNLPMPVADEKIDFLLKLPRNVNEFETQFSGVPQLYTNEVKSAIWQIKGIIECAVKFGINQENIIFTPLLVNHKPFLGITFTVVHKRESFVIANGGRFEELIKKCASSIENGKTPEVSAVDISFNIENVTKLLRLTKSLVTTDVLIKVEQRSAAIPLLKELLLRNIKSEIVTELTATDIVNKRPYIVVELSGNDFKTATAKQVKESSRKKKRTWILHEVHTGKLKKDFVNWLEVWISKESGRNQQTKLKVKTDLSDE